MSKIIKAQAGVAVRAIPAIAPALPAIESVVSKVLPVIGGVPGVIASTLFDIATGGKSGRPGASQRNSGSSVAAADATRVARPVIVPTRRDVNLHLVGTRAIPVYTGQSSTATPVMGKKKKARKARPAITRTPDKESTSVPVGSGAIDGSENAAQRDTVRVTNGAAVENATPQDTVKVQHENAENTEQTTDNRNILQRLGDRWARRKRQNNSTTNPENKPPRNWRNKAKTVGKWGMYGFVANEADNRFLNGRVKKIIKGVLDLGFDKPDTVYVQQSAKNGVQQQQSEHVQNDTTHAYNGFLINQRNLVE